MSLQSFKIERAYQHKLPPCSELTLILIGCGGTGGYLAQALAALAFHARHQGIDVRLTFIDGDKVETKNVGRQTFCEAEIGLNKAEALMWRLNAAYGLRISAIPQMATVKRLNDWRIGYNSRAHQTLLIGAVDTPSGRNAIAKKVDAHNDAIWWLDTGNAYANGHILIGNKGGKITPPKLDMGLWQDLPAPHVQEPALLQAAPKQQADLSCAERQIRNEQSLMVNRTVAAIAAQVASGFILERSVQAFATYFNLLPPSMTSKTLTPSNLAPYIAPQTSAEPT